MKKVILRCLLIAASFSVFSCDDKQDTGDKSVDSEPMLIIKFKLDPNQVRLNNLGQPSTLAAGHAAQSPVFNTISSHYLELAPNAYTQIGKGTILYHAPETTVGGSKAIDFSKAKIVAQGETFLEIPLKSITSGDYEWIRVSLSYQNYQISVRNSGQDFNGTLASFVGFNTYINSFSVANSSFQVNGNKPQGYWAFALNDYPFSTSGQAPEGSTTVPNPLASTSPIPAGSCVVTGKFEKPLAITGLEKENIEVTLSLSTNKSFEWIDLNNDGKYEPSAGETVVDMGLRGLIPTYAK